MMGLDELHYYDLYAPLVAVGRPRLPRRRGAAATIVTALAPLGTDYAAVMQRAFKERWIDLYPTPGKRSGAYSNGGAYDVHPYMLINYNGKYTDVSTLAHELGHTMQSYFSNKTQPYPTADYPIFVAEVASTFNEALLIDHMLKSIKDDAARLSLLGNYLENIKGTVFRQTQFAEFELRMHEMAEKGEPLTGDALVGALRRHHEEVLRPRRGRLRRRRLHRPRVGVHPALLPGLLRLPVRHLVHRVRGALREGARRRQSRPRRATWRSSRPAARNTRSTCCKDAGVDMTTDEPLELTIAEDEPRDGRDGEAAGEIAVTNAPRPRPQPLAPSP